MNNSVNLDWIEYMGVMASLAVTIALSYNAYRKRSEIANSTRISLVTITMSLIASFTSGVSLLGKPAESYAYGIDFMCFYLTSVFVNFFLLNFVYMPVVANLNTSSVYEYFDYRFNAYVRKLVSSGFVITRILQASIAVLPPALVINKFSDIGVNSLIIGLVAVTTFSTMIGGFKGVVLTDTLQGTIMLLSMAILCTLSVVQVGGLERVIEIAYSTGRLTPPNLSIDPTDRVSIWSYLAFMHACSSLLLNQSSYQRMKSLPSIKEMRIAMTWQLLGMVAFALASCFVGLSVHAYYFGCDPKEAKLVDSASDVIVRWVNEVGEQMSGFRGMYLAGITCASVSTISTHLNSIAELTCKELFNSESDNHVRLVTIAVGTLTTVTAIFFKKSSSLVEMTFAFASLDGITSGLFILGTLVIPANSKGALTSGIFSLLTTLLFAVGSRYYNAHGSLKAYETKPMRTDLCLFNVSRPVTQITHETSETVFYLFRISPFFYAIIAVINTVVIGLVVSLLFPEKKEDKTGEIHLFSPLVHRFLRRTLPTTQTSGEEKKLMRLSRERTNMRNFDEVRKFVGDNN